MLAASATGRGDAVLDYMLAVDLPKTLQFLQPGWFILHLSAIPLVFVLGMALGRRNTMRAGSTGTQFGT